MRPRHSLSLALALGLAIVASEACSLELRQMLALTVKADAPGGTSRSFGTLGTFMRRVRRAGYTCQLSPYEHGIDITCGKPNVPPHIFIDLDLQPSLDPEFAYADSIRANGINGGEIPVADRARFLGTLARMGGVPSP